MNSLFITLDAAAGGINPTMMNVLMIGGIIVVFYFFMIRPQQKKQKAIQEARNSMKVGDKVVTAGGVHGKIKEIGDTYLIVEIAENVKIKIEKGSVYGVSDSGEIAKQ